MRKKVNACEYWCYKRILKISWRDRVKNEVVLERMHTNLHFMEDMIKRKMKYAGHVMRGSSGLSHLQILEGRLEGKQKIGRQKRKWMDDITDWRGLETYGEVKRAAE